MAYVETSRSGAIAIGDHEYAIDIVGVCLPTDLNTTATKWDTPVTGGPTRGDFAETGSSALRAVYGSIQVDPKPSAGRLYVRARAIGLYPKPL